MRRFSLTLALVLAAALTVAAVALAVSLRDRDDITTGMDISKSAGAHNRSSDELVHTIDFYEAVDPATLSTKDRPPSSVCVEIWTRSRPRESAPDYEACASAAGGAVGWKGSVSRKRERGSPLRVGAVKVEQAGERRLVLRLDPDDIKRPASYRWRSESTSFARDCRNRGGCLDYAPDRPDTAETQLGRPRD